MHIRCSHQYIQIVLIALTFFILAPFAVSAYESTEQEVVQLTDDSYLFLITYEFGFLNAEAWLPIGAYRDSVDRTDFLTYELVDMGNATVDGGRTSGVVLSDAKIVEGWYHLPEGERHTFTLAVFATDLHENAVDPEAIAMRVSRLPFMLARRGEDVSESMVASDVLKGYETPSQLEVEQGILIDLVADVEYESR